MALAVTPVAHCPVTWGVCGYWRTHRCVRGFLPGHTDTDQHGCQCGAVKRRARRKVLDKGAEHPPY